MYRAKRDHSAGELEGRETPAFPAGVRGPKLERLTHRLLDLLSGLEVKDTPAAGEKTPVSRTVP